MPVVVDTSVWIEYFQNGNNFEQLDFLIDENLVVTNDLILAELIPFLQIRNHRIIINLLNNIDKLELIIHWGQIIDYHYTCQKNGVNGIGIPDLIIAQNAIQNHCEVYSLDSHFSVLMNLFMGRG